MFAEVGEVPPSKFICIAPPLLASSFFGDEYKYGAYLSIPESGGWIGPRIDPILDAVELGTNVCRDMSAFEKWSLILKLII